MSESEPVEGNRDMADVSIEPIIQEKESTSSVPVDVSNDKVKIDIKTFQWFYDRQFNAFFEVVKLKSKTSVEVRCLSCPPQKTLTVTINSAYNLNIHMKSTHKSMDDRFLERTKKRKNTVSALADENDPKQKQMRLDEFNRNGVVNQAKVDELVLNYIIEKVLPFSTVESDSFKALILTGRPNTLKVMTRIKLVDLLIKEYQLLKNGQIDEFSRIQYFCLTADIWSSRRRSFLGITIHWICPQSYSRKKGVLACRRLTGKHSACVLAANIEEIIKSFKIPIRKILKIITDGGSNFKKAFKDHQVEVEVFEDEYDDDELTELLAESDNDIFLPPHDRCASHSLCLVLTSDIRLKKQRKDKKGAQKKKEVPLPASVIEFNGFREKTLDPVLKKCQDLFNKQSNSTKAADLVHSYLNRYLVTPSPTRWNSLYDSVLLLSQLLDEKPEEMFNVMTGLGLDKISSKDHDVLKEYIKITENVADALDVLQGEHYMYQGVFYPTIHKMTQKINAVSDLKFCTILKNRILESIEKRFPDYMKDDYLKASLLHPLFKTYHITSVSAKERLIKELAVELQEIMDKSCVMEPAKPTKNHSDIQNLKTFQRLFDYDVDSGFNGSNASSTVKAEVILHNFLSNIDTSIESLKNYPEIGQLFIKYNTVLCSSAACERLFSLAKYVLQADRCQLKDENFEAQLIMKAIRFPTKIQF